MNVSVENLGPCKKLMKIEVEVPRVEAAFLEIENEYHKNAALPGFRKGKAPKDIILKQFGKHIEEEAKKKLTGEAYREAVKAQSLAVVAVLKVEDIQFERGQPVQIAVTLEVDPEYELPEYRGLPAQREDAKVADADIDRALEALRDRAATFDTVEAAVSEGHYVVVNYKGTCDGQPLTAIAPTARGLTEQKNFWIEVKPDSFIPGFASQLVGVKAGEKKTVTVTFPADFVSPALANKTGVYEVELVAVKTKKLAELNDEFAKQWEAESMAKLREGVRKDLQNELNEREDRGVRNQVVLHLMRQIKCDLPESVVAAETRNVVYELVNESQRHGATNEVIENEKEKIYNTARGVAMERVRASLVFKRIADKEGITVTSQEFDTELYNAAKAMQTTVDKLKKDLAKGDGGEHIAQNILNRKVINFLKDHARIEVVPVGQLKETA